MGSGSGDELISSIAPDVMRCLGQSGYFEKLDDLLSPEGASTPCRTWDGTYKISESILLASGFDQTELGDIFAVLRSQGGCCDCEVLYNVVETSRLKARYWRKRAAEQNAPIGHNTPVKHA